MLLLFYTIVTTVSILCDGLFQNCYEDTWSKIDFFRIILFKFLLFKVEKFGDQPRINKVQLFLELNTKNEPGKVLVQDFYSSKYEGLFSFHEHT